MLPIAEAGARDVEVRPGTATDTGLPPASVDLAMLRHVLGHNAAREREIVDHLAPLVRPGGSVLLADVDGTALRVLDADPVLADLNDRYVELQGRQGNDLKAARAPAARVGRPRGDGGPGHRLRRRRAPLGGRLRPEGRRGAASHALHALVRRHRHPLRPGRVRRRG